LKGLCFLLKKIPICYCYFRRKLQVFYYSLDLIVIFCLWLEFGRSTNTGIDLAHACPNIRLLVNTLPESEETINRILYQSNIQKSNANSNENEKNSQSHENFVKNEEMTTLSFNPNVFILFPSSRSISVILYKLIWNVVKLFLNVLLQKISFFII
jgi:hypothetical protein